ncbi:MAG: pseudouridine synthase [Georgfuchsia sp.]
MPSLPLDRILQSQGFGTRKYCRQMIADGEVAINGETVRDYRQLFDTSALEFSLFDEVWRYREHIYIAMHKPSGRECSRKPSHHPPVLDLLPEQMRWRDVQPVGRLDLDTTGLLLFSDDGAFIHAQSSPKRHIPKLYVATTYEPVTDDLLLALRTGVQLIDELVPLAATHCRRLDEHAIEIALEQGKYHQVKRMLAAAGNHCTGLSRVAIGGLTLEALGLAEGEWTFLEADQLAQLQANNPEY